MYQVTNVICWHCHDLGISSKGHLKVTARSNQRETAENILFLLFFNNYTLDDKIISRSQQRQIIYKQRVIIACFCCFYYNSVHFRLRQNLGLTPLWSPTPTHVTMCWCRWGITPSALCFYCNYNNQIDPDVPVQQFSTHNKWRAISSRHVILVTLITSIYYLTLLVLRTIILFD